MTHDELVRFAAGKVDITAIKNDGWGGGWLRKEGGQTDWSRIFGTEGSALAYGIDLTSPELFLKGLEAFEKSGGDWVINKNGMLLGLGNDDRYIPVTGFYKISDIPPTFWQCWAELEGGQG